MEAIGIVFLIFVALNVLMLLAMPACRSHERARMRRRQMATWRRVLEANQR